MGGSIIKHGGQNPLEATRFGCRIVHGPHIENFKDIYKLLSEYKIAKKISDTKNFEKNIRFFLEDKKSTNFIVKKLII